MPWKFGEEEKVERFMPINILLGRERRRIVLVSGEVGWDMLKRGLGVVSSMRPRYFAICSVQSTEIYSPDHEQDNLH